MFGLNRRITLIEVNRTISDSGAVGTDAETIIAHGVKATIQAMVLGNLPPPPDHPTPAGHFYLREFTCWVATRSLPGIQPLVHWIVMDEATGERWRIHGVIDDAGRSHHWRFRMENYEG